METNKYPTFNFRKRLSSMIKVDFRRMFTMPIYYIILGISFIIPILILVMTTLMVGTESVDAVTGEVTIMEPIFTNVWQIIASIPSNNTEMTMDITTMCNIDMMFFAGAVLVCIFVSEDFKSGYAKNLFTIRSNKVDYVVSKTIIGIVCGITMLVAFFIGALIGGAISNLSFELVGVNVINVVMCIISKFLLVAVFVPIFLVMSIVGKQRTWLSMILSFATSMLLFTMVSMISPLNATFMNVVLSFAGALMFSFGIGAISNLVLKKSSLV